MKDNGSTETPIGETRMCIAELPWERIDADLDERGVAHLGTLLAPHACDSLRRLYDAPHTFRNKVVMARHGFGLGEYQYFDYPLPHTVGCIREAIYPHAARTANRWADQLNAATHYPNTLCEMLTRCHAGGQTRATPLILKYTTGDYNCLHQDIYGEHIFPLQLVILLSATDAFEGGEFVLTEQRPRMQSRVEVISLQQGEAALFCVNERPRKSARGYHRVKMRHGVSQLRAGTRFALGIIFHDAA